MSSIGVVKGILGVHALCNAQSSVSIKLPQINTDQTGVGVVIKSWAALADPLATRIVRVPCRCSRTFSKKLPYGTFHV